MPPKKTNKTEQLKSACLRCPEQDLLQPQPTGKKKAKPPVEDSIADAVRHDLRKCVQKHPESYSDLWWPFEEGDANLTHLQSVEECQALLNFVKQKLAPYAVFQLRAGIEELKEIGVKLEFNEYQVYKSTMHHALQMVLEDADQKEEKRKTSKQADKDVKHKDRLRDYERKQADAAALTSIAKPLAPKGRSHRDTEAVRVAPKPDPFRAVTADMTQDLEPGTALNTIAEFADKARLLQGWRHKTTSLDEQVEDLSLEPTKRKPILEMHALRPSFAWPETRKVVLSNHFTVELPQGKVLYEYRVVGIPPKASRSKKRVLLLDFIESTEALWDKRHEIATDYQQVIISCEPLHANATAEPEEGVLKATIANYDAGKRTAMKLTLNFAGRHNLDGLRNFVQGNDEHYQDSGAAAAMNIVMSKAVADANKDTFQVGNSRFYYRPDWSELQTPSERQSAGTIAVRGYFSSIRPGMGQILLNVNTVCTAFYKAQPLTDYCHQMNLAGTGAIDAKVLTSADDHLSGLRVWVDFERAKENGDPDIDSAKRRMKTLVALGQKPVQQETKVDGKTTTVWEHLSKKYEIKSREGQQFPTANIGRREPGNEKFYLATQLIVTSDQVYRRDLTPGMTEKMINFARKHSRETHAAILSRGMTSLNFQNQSTILGKLGIQVSQGMVKVPAKGLEAPKIVYPEGTATPRTGFWKPGQGNNIKEMKLPGLTSGFPRQQNWSPTIVFCRPDDSMRYPWHESAYISAFLSKLGQSGVRNLDKSHQRCEKIQKWSVEDLTMKFGGLKQAPDLVVVIFPIQSTKHRDYYANLKIALDQTLGIRSICLCEESMYKSISVPPEQKNMPRDVTDATLEDYMRNIILKINLRLGNYNHHLHKDDLPVIGGESCDTIVLGADVTHPGGNGVPSIAAVVGSVDKDFARFFGSMRLNKPREDIIDEMKDMVKERLRAWGSYTSGTKLPSKILFYRDGVGESKYAKLRETEVLHIREAWGELFRETHGTMPQEHEDVRITVVVVTKRHHTRFFPEELERPFHGKPHEKGYKVKCEAGTLVESGITSPYYYDFFLLSHNANAGTPRPSHYMVLEDGIGFHPRDLQQLTYNLCYLYGRSFTAVSYAPAAYYADRLCERGRAFLKPLFQQSLKGLGEEEVLERAEKVFYAQGRGATEKRSPWHPNHDHTMFWM